MKLFKIASKISGTLVLFPNNTKVIIQVCKRYDNYFRSISLIKLREMILKIGIEPTDKLNNLLWMNSDPELISDTTEIDYELDFHDDTSWNELKEALN